MADRVRVPRCRPRGGRRDHRAAGTAHHHSHRRRGALIIGVVGHAAAWPLIAATSSAWIVAVLLAAIGASQTLITTVNAGLRQLLVPADMLGRTIAGFRAVANSASPAGAVIGGLIATELGLRGPLFAAGLILGVAVAASWWLLLRRR
ncbi:MFS transporter [Micromonospora arborensis]|uniref:MFS transporter n=1 Tax=Micromonospora arborensis TaxID=2116518 RepID=UPI0033F71645